MIAILVSVDVEYSISAETSSGLCCSNSSFDNLGKVLILLQHYLFSHIFPSDKFVSLIMNRYGNAFKQSFSHLSS